MENLLAEHHPEPEVKVIEPEIVGFEPKPTWWQQLKARALVSLALGVAGLVICAIGAVLTLSIIGAAIGIPMILLGLFAIVIAIYLIVGGGKMKVVSFRSFR